MKIISKKSLLIIGGILCTASFGLMFVSAADRILSTDLHNAIHHIDQVNFIPTGNVTTVTMKKNNQRLVQIDTDNFILGQSGDNQNNADGAGYGSILGGKKNKITGSYNIILGGYKNYSEGTHNSILGGEGNRLTLYQSNNTIIGGQDNQITGSNSYEEGRSEDFNYNVIVGGANNKINRSRNSVVIGTNSSVEGINSVALGSNSHIKADNSFLWTDGNFSEETLQADDIFAVNAQSGVIINTNKAHSFAKLTLGGSLVLSDSDKQSDIVCEGGQGEGIMKIEKSENDQLCLCSCDGYGWSSMSSKGRCLSTCNQSMEPPQCGSEVSAICANRGITYSGSCANGKVIEGTGAYFVDKNDIVHRSCQTEDGQTNSSCTGKASWAEDMFSCLSRLSTCVGGAATDKQGNPCSSTITCKANQISHFNEDTQQRECEYLGECTNERGIYNPNNNKNLEGFSNNYDYKRYLPVGTDKKWTCKDEGITEEDIHSCTFSCDAGYECTLIASGASVTSHNKYRTCAQKQTTCVGDYTVRDGSLDKYKQRTYDDHRYGTVYKNPNTLNNTFTFINSKNDINTDQQGCYIICNPGYHEPVVEDGYDKEVVYYNRGHCLPTCQDLRRSPVYNNRTGYTATGHTKLYIDYRRPWKYKEFDVYSGIINSTSAGSGKSNSCLWSCPEGSTPIRIDGIKPNKHAYRLSGEFKGDTIITGFEEFLHDERNKDVYDNGQYAFCRHQCTDNQYFNGYGCVGIGKYTGDNTNCITFNGIKNCGRTNECPAGQLRSYTTKKCEPKSVTLKQLCDEKIANGQTRYRRINNECIMCETPGQYVTDDGGCALCENPSSPECTPQST